MDLNKVQLIGRVTKDVEVKTVSNGNKVANFSLATNRYWTDQSGQKQTVAEFHNCVVWGKLADIAESYVQKGKKIYFEGRNETRSWEAEDGTKRYKTDIVGENIILLDSANSNNTGSDLDGNNASKVTPAKAAPKKEEEVSIEDIPF